MFLTSLKQTLLFILVICVEGFTMNSEIKIIANVKANVLPKPSRGVTGVKLLHILLRPTYS